MNFTEKKRKILREIDTKEVRTKNGIPYEVFTNTPKAIQITDKDVGKRVWYIGETRTTHIRLEELKEDHVVIKYRGGSQRAVYYNEVLLHPKEWNNERLGNV